MFRYPARNIKQSHVCLQVKPGSDTLPQFLALAPLGLGLFRVPASHLSVADVKHADHHLHTFRNTGANAFSTYDKFDELNDLEYSRAMASSRTYGTTSNTTRAGLQGSSLSASSSGSARLQSSRSGSSAGSFRAPERSRIKSSKSGLLGTPFQLWSLSQKRRDRSGDYGDHARAHRDQDIGPSLGDSSTRKTPRLQQSSDVASLRTPTLRHTLPADDDKSDVLGTPFQLWSLSQKSVRDTQSGGGRRGSGNGGSSKASNSRRGNNRSGISIEFSDDRIGRDRRSYCLSDDSSHSQPDTSAEKSTLDSELEVEPSNEDEKQPDPRTPSAFADVEPRPFNHLSSQTNVYTNSLVDNSDPGLSYEMTTPSESSIFDGSVQITEGRNDRQQHPRDRTKQLGGKGVEWIDFEEKDYPSPNPGSTASSKKGETVNGDMATTADTANAAKDFEGGDNPGVDGAFSRAGLAIDHGREGNQEPGLYNNHGSNQFTGKSCQLTTSSRQNDWSPEQHSGLPAYMSLREARYELHAIPATFISPRVSPSLSPPGPQHSADSEREQGRGRQRTQNRRIVRPSWTAGPFYAIRLYWSHPLIPDMVSK